MHPTPYWFGAIFPMTDNPDMENFLSNRDVIEYLRSELQDPKDHDHNYAVHYEERKPGRVKQAWNNEIMLFPFPSNKLGFESTVFFKWNGDESLYGYGLVEKVIPNNRSDQAFPLDGTWDYKIYPYIVKFLNSSIHINTSGVSSGVWCRVLGRGKTPRKDAYLKLSYEEVESLKKLID